MARKTSKKSPHRSFRRSYREDYQHTLEVPSMLYHIAVTFKMIFKNFKLFLPLILIMSVVAFLTINTVDKTGTVVIATFLFLISWLTTIFILRHIMAKHKIKLRDAFYNAMTPLVQTFVVFFVAAIESLPIVLLIIAYETAIETNFLSLPFYALLFLVFAAVMVVISAYFLSSTLIALVAVSAPGIYPMVAFKTASELMAERRMRFIFRLVVLALVLVAIWMAILAPMVMFAPTLIMTAAVEILASFSSVYIAAYLYLYYRWMLGYDTKEVKNDKK